MKNRFFILRNLLLGIVITLVLFEGVFVYWERLPRFTRNDGVVIEAAAYRTQIGPIDYIIDWPVNDPKYAEHIKLLLHELEDARKMASNLLGCSIPYPITVRITAKVDQTMAGGATTFARDRGRVFGFKMTIQGPTRGGKIFTIARHEITHVVTAICFSQNIFIHRWIDESLSNLVEDPIGVIGSAMKGGCPVFKIRQLLQITEYPASMPAVLALYNNSTLLLTYLLLEEGGVPNMRSFLKRISNSENPIGVFQDVYKMTPEQADKKWCQWVRDTISSDLNKQNEVIKNIVDKLSKVTGTYVNLAQICQRFSPKLIPPQKPKVASIYLYIVDIDKIPNSPVYQRHRSRIIALINNSKELIAFLDEKASANWRDFVIIVNERPVWDNLEQRVAIFPVVINDGGNFLSAEALRLLLHNAVR